VSLLFRNSADVILHRKCNEGSSSMISFAMATSAQHPPERPFLTIHAWRHRPRTPPLLEANLLYPQPTPPSQSDPKRAFVGRLRRPAQSPVALALGRFRERTITILGGLWRFLRRKRKHELIGWLTGGIVVASGTWVVLLIPPHKPQPQGSQP
jgi:hypothetical protein